MVPLSSGNLGVESLMAAVAGRPLPAPGLHDQELLRMRDLGVGAAEDYIGWGAIERRPDEVDLSFHRHDLERCRELGLRYHVYAWVHVVPAWFRERGVVEGSRCLEHDGECGWPSSFAPSTLDLYERFLAQLADGFGSELDTLWLGAPSDYGECGQPTGMGLWVAPLPAPVDHVHVGLWAGDPHARRALADFALERHGSLAAVERALGLRLRTPADLSPPTAASSKEHRRLFADFYLDATARFLDGVLRRARRLFPKVALGLKLGHGGECLAYGIDPSAIAAVAARHGAILRSTQSTLPEIHQQRASAPCHFHGVPFETESPADVGREQALGRLFADAANGAAAYFDFPEHLVASRDLLDRYDAVLDGDLPDRDVAVLFPSADQRLHPEWGLPPVLYQLADPLRARLDHALIDESLIEAGALRDVRVFVILQAEELAECTQRAILSAVEAGTWLVVGPDAAATLRGPLAEVLARTPDADAELRFQGEAPPCVEWDIGRRGDLERIAGDWYEPESARQFGGATRDGDWCRWTGASARLWMPVHAGVDHLLEVQAWVHPATVARAHGLWLDGELVDGFSRPGLQRFAAWLPGSRLRSSVARLEFRSDTFRGAEIGNPGDERDLGLNVLWVRATRRGAAAAVEVGPGRLHSDLDVARMQRSGRALGAGRVYVSRSRPWLCALEWIVAAARLRSRSNAPWLGGNRPEGVQYARRRASVLLHRTRAEPATVELVADGRREVVDLEPGALAVVPWS